MHPRGRDGHDGRDDMPDIGSDPFIASGKCGGVWPEQGPPEHWRFKKHPGAYKHPGCGLWVDGPEPRHGGGGGCGSAHCRRRHTLMLWIIIMLLLVIIVMLMKQMRLV